MAGDLRRPIILLGNFRSGTTMLQRIIAKHPDVVELYEPVGLWLYADPSRNHDEFDESDATNRVKSYIRGQFLKYQQEHGGRIIIEKTPHNIMRIPYVREIFPEAHFLYIVRNPLSFISSVELKWQRPAGSKRILKRVRSTPLTQIHHYLKPFLSQQWQKRVLRRKYLSIWGPRYKGIQEDLRNEDMLTVIARQWARAARKAERDLARIDDRQLLRVQVRGLRWKVPIEYLHRICQHCGLQMTDAMADHVRMTVKTDRLDKWQRFDAQQLARILPELSEQMIREDYDIPEEIARLARS